MGLARMENGIPIEASRLDLLRLTKSAHTRYALRFGDRSCIDSTPDLNLPDFSSTESLETNIITGGAPSATGSDNSHSLTWYARDHSQDTSTQGPFQPPPVRSSTTNDLMQQSTGLLESIAPGAPALPPNSHALATNAELRYFAPTAPSPSTSSHALQQPDTYRAPTTLHQRAAASPQHHLSAYTNGAILPKGSLPAQHSKICCPSTLDGAATSAPCLRQQDPSQDLSCTVLRPACAESYPDCSGNPFPANYLTCSNEPDHQRALLRY